MLLYQVACAPRALDVHKPFVLCCALGDRVLSSPMDSRKAGRTAQQSKGHLTTASAAAEVDKASGDCTCLTLLLLDMMLDHKAYHELCEVDMTLVVLFTFKF